MSNLSKPIWIGLACLAIALFALPLASAQDPAAGGATTDPRGLIALGAGLAVGIAGLGTGLAMKDIGAAAVGAIAEDPGMLGKGILFVAIPETIVIFGFVIGFLLYGQV